MSVPQPVKTLARVIFALALVGVLVVAHLQFQSSQDFAFGCSGVAEAGTESGCASVTNSRWADFLGVSNIVWGFLFYVPLVLLRFGYAATGNDRFRLASFGFVGVGFLYTLYLVYLQLAEIGSFCVLCLLSAATVTLLLLLHVMEHRRLQNIPESQTERTPAASTLKPYYLIVGVAVLLLVGDAVVAGGLLRSGEDAGPTSENVASTQEQAGTATQPQQELGCEYDPNHSTITAFERFTDGPVEGNPDASVAVVEIFDPSCPHCKEMEGIMADVIEANRDKARFYAVPFALRQQSVGQIVLLHMAEEEGTFFEVKEELFRRQNGAWGMSLDEIVATANAAGMNGGVIRGQFQNQTVMDPLIQQVSERNQVIQAAFTPIGGGMSVPKVAINGRVLAASYEAYNEECISRLIDEAAAE